MARQAAREKRLNRAASRSPPDQRAIVRRHRDIGDEAQPHRLGQRANGFEIANARTRVAGLQPSIEVAIAVAGVGAVAIERAIDGDRGVSAANRAGKPAKNACTSGQPMMCRVFALNTAS
jgi:hypothetical protein